MAESIHLDAELRQLVGKGNPALRRSGRVPAVVYGHRESPTHVSVDLKAATTALRRAGRNGLITLNIATQAEPRMALSREVQRDPIKRTIKHIDFYEVSMTEKLTADVTVVMFGESADIKSGQGVLLEGQHRLSIRCLPADLFDEIRVDVSKMKIGDIIRVKDLAVKQGVEVLADPDDEIARMVRYVEAKVEEAAGAATGDVEVIEKGKKDEEGTEAAAGKPAGKAAAPAAKAAAPAAKK
ncbi:MAG: 50S ribosomal protein L25 [Thermoflexales bacterium]|nr:50S ribosomal protein L25 [Thermoflexales bacterium]